MSTASVSLLVDGLAFGEGPRWHDGKLFLSDMHAHRVLAIDGDGTVTTVAEHDAPLPASAGCPTVACSSSRWTARCCASTRPGSSCTPTSPRSRRTASTT